MSHPLSTPSGINRATPVPRSPDGSPLPSAKVAELRANERARQAAADAHSVLQAEQRKIAGTGPLSPEETDRRLDLWDQKPLPELKEQGKRVSKAGEPESVNWVDPNSVAQAVQLATPEDEANLQATYGKSSEELAAEAEKGYDNPQVDLATGEMTDPTVKTSPAFPDDPALQRVIDDADLKITVDRADFERELNPETDEQREEREFQEEMLKEAMTDPTVNDPKPEPAKKAPAAKKAAAKTQAQKNREIANAHKAEGKTP